jgi:flagellin
MGMQINTNLAANNAYRNLSNTQNDLSKSLEKLSSGLRINRAGDDAAGLALSEGLKSQIGGLTVAARNAQDGIGAIQTAEGGLNQAHSILQRLRDLGVQAANDTNNDASRTAITTEATSLVGELGRIKDSTNFNGRQLLDGSQSTMNIQVGADKSPSSTVSIDLAGANLKDVTDVLTTGRKSADVALLDETKGTQFSQGNVSVNVAALGAGVTDAAKQAEALNLNTEFASVFTASLSATNDLVVTSKSGSTSAVTVKQQATTTTTDPYTVAKDTARADATLDFMSNATAQDAIKLVDDQIKIVSDARSKLGATQNRLESAVQTINVSKENLTASNSRLRDTDMAEEMVKFTRNNILSQAGTAMLAQANQSNQGVLQLLR